MSNAAEFLSGMEGADLTSESGGEAGSQDVGLKPLSRHLWSMFMAQQEIEDCQRLYPNFECLWNGRIAFVVQGSDIRRIISPDVSSPQEIEPGVLVLDRQRQEILLASDFEREKERASNPFPIARSMLRESARWIVFVSNKYMKESEIKRGILQVEQAFREPQVSKPRVLVDTYLRQSRSSELNGFKTRKVDLDSLDHEDADQLQEAVAAGRITPPRSAIRWWRDLQKQVPRHGRMITVFTPLTTDSFLNMVFWNSGRTGWMSVPGLIKTGSALTLRWTLKGVKLRHQLLITDR